MSDNITELNEKNFSSTTKKGKWVIDFWAEWCGPCKIMAPHFESAAKELKGKIHFGKVNIEENYSLTEKYNIMSIPTTLFLLDGEVIHASVGAMNKSQIDEQIENNFN
mgnify:CR=1 FL=1